MDLMVKSTKKMDQMEYEIMTEEQVKVTVQLMLQEHLKGISEKLNSLTKRFDDFCQGSRDTNDLMHGMIEEVRLARMESQNNYRNLALRLLKEEQMTSEVHVQQAKGPHNLGDALNGTVIADIKPSIDDMHGRGLVKVPSTRVCVSDIGQNRNYQEGKEPGLGGHCTLPQANLPSLSTNWHRKEVTNMRESTTFQKTCEETRAARASAECSLVQKDALRVCPHCPRKFEHGHSLALHIPSCRKKSKSLEKAKPTGLVDNNFKKLNSGSVMDMRNPAKMIRCGHCERSFPTLHQVRSHERVHTGARPYACHVCQITFAHGGNMIKHIKSKHPSYNPYSCHHCKATFKTHEIAHQHRKTCTPSRKPTINVESLFTPPATGSQTDIVDGKMHKRGRDSEETVTANEDEDEDFPPSKSPTSVVKESAENFVSEIQPESGLEQPFSREEVENVGVMDMSQVILPN